MPAIPWVVIAPPVAARQAIRTRLASWQRERGGLEVGIPPQQIMPNMSIDIDLAPLTMLIVDSGSYDRSLIRSILTSLGAGTTLQAAGQAEAVALLADRPVDLIIADHHSGGVALTCQIRRGETGGRVTLPIIMVSGSADGGKAAEARDAGVDEFMAKPVTADSLGWRVRSALGHPRQFVRSPAYVGPCRRSIELPPENGERRANPVGDDQHPSRRHYPAGAVIFTEGEAAEEAFVVESGRVVLSRRIGDICVALGGLGPQGIFGELALADETLRAATATAAEDTLCLVLPKRALGAQISRSPDLVVLVLETLLHNIGKMGRELVEAHARLQAE